MCRRWSRPLPALWRNCIARATSPSPSTCRTTPGSVASSRTSKRWSAISSIMPANGPNRASPSRLWRSGPPHWPTGTSMTIAARSRACVSSLMTMGPDCRRQSVNRSPCAVSVSMRPSPAPAWASPSSSSWPVFMAAYSRLAPHRSAGYAPNWRCRAARAQHLSGRMAVEVARLRRLLLPLRRHLRGAFSSRHAAWAEFLAGNIVLGRQLLFLELGRHCVAPAAFQDQPIRSPRGSSEQTVRSVGSILQFATEVDDVGVFRLQPGARFRRVLVLTEQSDRFDFGDECRVLCRRSNIADECGTHVVRQSMRRVETHDQVQPVYGDAFLRKSRNLGQLRQPVGRRCCQRAQLPGFEHGSTGGVRHHADIHLPAENGCGELRAARKRYGDHLQFEVMRKRLHAQ